MVAAVENPLPPPIMLVEKSMHITPWCNLSQKPAKAVLPPAYEKSTHPEGVVIEIVGITAKDQGHSCKEHSCCGEVIHQEDLLVCLRKVRVMWPSKDGGPGKEVDAITVYWVTDGVNHCHIGFLPHHMAK